MNPFDPFPPLGTKMPTDVNRAPPAPVSVLAPSGQSPEGADVDIFVYSKSSKITNSKTYKTEYEAGKTPYRVFPESVYRVYSESGASTKGSSKVFIHEDEEPSSDDNYYESSGYYDDDSYSDSGTLHSSYDFHSKSAKGCKSAKSKSSKFGKGCSNQGEGSSLFEPLMSMSLPSASGELSDVTTPDGLPVGDGEVGTTDIEGPDGGLPPSDNNSTDVAEPEDEGSSLPGGIDIPGGLPDGVPSLPNPSDVLGGIGGFAGFGTRLGQIPNSSVAKSSPRGLALVMTSLYVVICFIIE